MVHIHLLALLNARSYGTSLPKHHKELQQGPHLGADDPLPVQAVILSATH